ncbi:MAG: CCA tRNA nucleotidyltransferase [Conexivisphaerales archaeon]
MLATLGDWVDTALSTVSPTKEEKARVDSVARDLLQRCSYAIEKSGIRAKVELGGSYAHNTWLPGEADVDAFIILPEGTSKEEVPKIGLKIANEALSGLHVIKRFAEHPYLESYIDKVRVDVVPCIEAKKGEWKTAADRSPYHTRYMLSSLNDEKKRQVRLLKRFMKAQNLYGAEIKIKGFSGYVCEVLIAKYNTFLDLVQQAAEWKDGIIITVQKIQEGKNEGIAILDPVDERRNLARAISNQKMAEFIHLCRIVHNRKIENPFEKRLLRYAKLTKGILEHAFVLAFEHKEENEDILWGELNRTSKNIAKHLTLDGFEVLNHNAYADNQKAAIAFLIANANRSDIIARNGPPIFYSKEHKRFLSSASISWVFTDDFRTKRLERRKIISLKQILDEYMTNNRAGIAKGLFQSASSTWKLFSGTEAVKSGKELLVKALEAVAGYEPMDSY